MTTVDIAKIRTSCQWQTPRQHDVLHVRNCEVWTPSLNIATWISRAGTNRYSKSPLIAFTGKLRKFARVGCYVCIFMARYIEQFYWNLVTHSNIQVAKLPWAYVRMWSVGLAPKMSVYASVACSFPYIWLCAGRVQLLKCVYRCETHLDPKNRTHSMSGTLSV